MSKTMLSLFRSSQLDDKNIERLFSLTTQLKKEFENNGTVKGLIDTQVASEKLVLLMFLEPSTRTRTSFEIAAKRMGCQVTLFDENLSSLKKGETHVDTFRNLTAMAPDLFVIRHGEDQALEHELMGSTIPVISGGQSAHGHPTQALLDLYTLLTELGSLHNKRILFVGDIRRGRAALSSLEIFNRYGAKMGWVGPSELSYQGDIPVQEFSTLAKGSEWADAVVGFRLQTERSQFGFGMAPDEYSRYFCLNSRSLSALKPEAIIMHPGPFNQGIDFDQALLQDPRSRVLAQVKNGVFVRMALMADSLGLWRNKK